MHNKENSNLERRSYIGVRNYICVVLFSHVSGSFLSSVIHPDHFFFLYSLNTGKEDIPWFRYLSIAELATITALFWFQTLLWDLFSVIFPMSIKISLQNIFPFAESETNDTIESILSETHDPTPAWKCYTNLNRLVNRCNALIGNAMLGMKFCFMLTMSLYVYIPIRQRNRYKSIVIALFIFSTFVIVWKLVLILTAMGGVHQKGIEFKERWKKFLTNDISGRWRNSGCLWMELFEYGPTIAFRGGELYDIQQSTILTFFSAVTTYVIVGLQI